MYEDEDGEEYVSDLDDAELTDYAPKFIRMPIVELGFQDLAAMRVDELIKMYIVERNQLATDRKGWKAREAVMKSHMAMISMALRDKGDNVGVNSFQTVEGTAYRRVTEKFTVADWAAVTDYIRNTDNFQILQKRVAPNAVKEIREADGDLPPGVSVMTEVDFAVRSPTARKSKSTVGQE